MMTDIEIWKKLYNEIDNFIFMKPWEYIWGEDLICIQFEDEEYPIYCSIMGKNKDCIALSLYYGCHGYEDFCSVSTYTHDHTTTKYIMFEQECLTFYLGDRDEVPKEQLMMMRKIGKSYRNHYYPYFLSFLPRYYPWGINDEQATFFHKTLKILNQIVFQIINDSIDIQFDHDEMIYAHFDHNQWIYEPMALPPFEDKFSPILLEDDIVDEIKQKSKTLDEYVIDLIYFNTFIEDDEYDRPANALLFIVFDYKKDKVIYMDLLHPEIDEIQYLLNYFINHIADNGIPHTLYIRNPNIFSTLFHLCKECQCEIKQCDFSFIDEIAEEIMEHMYE